MKETTRYRRPIGRSTFALKMKALERKLIVDTLRENNNNLSKAARAFGLSSPTLHVKLQALGITKRTKMVPATVWE